MNNVALIKIEEDKMMNSMIPTNLTELEKNFYRISKKHDVGMSFCKEKRIEIAELDNKKAAAFIEDIKKISKETQVVDLIKSKQNIDVKGNKMPDGKPLYLVDEKYYRMLLGEETNKQLSLF